MAETSAIAWTRSTFNPWMGCTRVGPGCDNCYAAVSTPARSMGIQWGPGEPRRRTSIHNWNQPLKWDKKAAEERAAGVLWNGRPGYWPVFCASLADVFDNEVPAEWRADLMQLIEKTPHLSWLLVTKRIGNVERMIEEAGDLIDYGEGWQSMWGQGKWPDNVRLLITVVNQEEADRDIPKLLRLECKNGISYEPALGPVDWSREILRVDGRYPFPHLEREYRTTWLDRLEWIIVGGESNQGGAKAGPSTSSGRASRWSNAARPACRCS